MKKLLSHSLILGVVFSMVAVGAVSPTSSQVQAAGNNKIDVFVGFNKTPGASEHAIVERVGGTVRFSYSIVPAVAASVPETAIQGLLHNPNVTSVELDGKVYAVDTELTNAWGVERIGSGTVHDRGNKGTGVKIGIIDSGVDYLHQDLDANYAGGYDFVENQDDLEVREGDGAMDVYGHGTHVAGTACAEDNGLGVVGVAPGCALYSLRVLNNSGSGSWSATIAAMDWAVLKGLQVVNLSLGSSQNPGGTVQAAFDNAEAKGLVIVAAGGNSGNPGGKGNNVIYPAKYASVIAVAATDKNNTRPSWSSTGEEIELAAPGVSVFSTWNDSDSSHNPQPTTLDGDWYKEGSGTSMASPHVAGVAALVLANGSLTDQNEDGAINNADLRLWLRKTADDLGTAGKDSWYGYGLVDADEAAPFTGPVDASPSISITNPVNGSVASGTIMITANASDDNGIAQVDFYLDGVLLGFDALNPYEWLWDSTGVSDGSHAITATAVDTALQSKSDSVSITVDNVNDPPVANAGPDQTAYVGATVSFDGSQSTDDRGIVSYAWDFGDGATASGAVVNHVYTATGIYTVTLTVVDSGGISASDTLTVTVNDPPAEAPRAIVDSVGYSTDGGKNQNLHLRIAPLVVDDLGNPVGGASVSITLNHDSGSSWSGTAVTDSSGKAYFKLNNAPSGCYTTTVTDVSAANLTWNGTTPVNSFCK